jgi:hypothetical protein
MGDATTYRRRVLIEDARGDGSYLRTTWHAERRAFVVSTWRDEVCTGAVRVPVAAAGDLARLLIDGLSDAATTTATPTTKPAPRPDVLARARAWLRRLIGRRPASAAKPTAARAQVEGTSPHRQTA